VTEPGHLFVTRGDLTQLACDGVLVPTDAARSVTGSWRRLIQTVPPAPDGWPEQPLPVVTGDARPNVWLVATAALREAGGTTEQVEEALALLLRRVERFVTYAAEALSTGARDQGRSRPLLALPIVGTGSGGLRARPGAVIRELVEQLGAAIDRLGVDIALVARTAEHEALCRHWRRRWWAARHHPDGYGEAVFGRWRSGHVVDGQVQVGPAIAELRALVAHAERDELVPFFGAGVSRASGLPSWTDLLDGLSPPGAIDLFGELSGADATHMADPFARAQVIANLDPDEGRSLRERLHQRLVMERLSLLHVLLANLGARDAITTNYDVGYERACGAAGSEVAIVPNGGSRRLVKLHGSLGEEGGEPLLTRDQLLDFHTDREALAGVLQMLLLTGHLLFVGYSMSDPSLHAAFHAVRRALESEAGEDTSTMATSLQVDPSPALSALWDRTVDVLWPDETRYPDTTARVRQKEILLDLLADVTSRGSIPVLAMDDEAAAADLTDEERALRTALQALDGVVRHAGTTAALWGPVEQLLERFGRR
jgi:hypothetical protein